MVPDLSALKCPGFFDSIYLVKVYTGHWKCPNPNTQIFRIYIWSYFKQKREVYRDTPPPHTHTHCVCVCVCWKGLRLPGGLSLLPLHCQKWIICYWFLHTLLHQRIHHSSISESISFPTISIKAFWLIRESHQTQVLNSCLVSRRPQDLCLDYFLGAQACGSD